MLCLAVVAVGLTIGQGSVLGARVTLSSDSRSGLGPRGSRARLNPTGGDSPRDTKFVCTDAGHISLLQTFDRLVGFSVNCEMLFNDAALNWQGWDDPWFLHTYSDMMWGRWAVAGHTHRQLVISEDLFPATELHRDWLSQGAAGDFEPYARDLARNLVRAGLGDSIIRLAHEANGSWDYDQIPNTPAGDAKWVQFWRNTVLAMRSVPGAHFKFDWTISAGYRDIPLNDWYPGNDVVNIIGVDVYDSGNLAARGRWSHFWNEPDGVGTVERFAAAHGKPMSIPEWGLEPSIDPAMQGGGDDPGFVRGIAATVREYDVAYQSYFFNSTELMQLENSPRSLAAYRAAFGERGYATSSVIRRGLDTSLSSIRLVPRPGLTLTGGPGFGSTVPSSTVRFAFRAAPRLVPECSLDGHPFKECTSGRDDLLTHLTPGFHWWTVRVYDTSERMTMFSTDFIVA